MKTKPYRLIIRARHTQIAAELEAPNKLFKPGCSTAACIAIISFFDLLTFNTL